MSVLEIIDLDVSLQSNFWSKRRHILKNVSLRVESGEIFGFLGPNGAGKTTTIKAILGLIRPTRGKVLVDGVSTLDPSARQHMGFMPEQAYYPEFLTGREVLDLHARLAGVSATHRTSRCKEVLERVGLANDAHRRLREYSKGMLQRIGLGQALIGNPSIVILDEPLAGVDPVGRHDMLSAFLDLRDAGHTVFFSTHILPDVETTCTRVALLINGSIGRCGTLSEILQDVEPRVSLVASGVKDTNMQGVVRFSQRLNQTLFEIESLESANRIIDSLRRQGATVHEVQESRGHVEDALVRMLRTEKAAS